MTMNIVKKLQQIGTRTRPIKPLFFRLSQSRDVTKLSKLIEKGDVRFVIDDFTEQQRELYAIRHPDQIMTPDFAQRQRDEIKKQNLATPPEAEGVWVYYPWNFTLVHLLNEEEFVSVRTARNKLLITDEEQKIFYHSCVGVGGLSVGSSIILTIILEGGARHVRLADMDRLALSNTNRIRTSLTELGSLKVEMVARQIYEINPFVTVDVLPDGLNSKTMRDFFVGPPKLDIVIDEVDALEVKYDIRQWAKKMRIPLIMAADNGSSGVIDIERYDLDQNTPFFHGRLGNITRKQLSKLTKLETGKMITRHVGLPNVETRMQRSLPEIGRTIVSWPQLGGTAMLNGGAMSYIVRSILNRQPIETNRAIISLPEKLVPRYTSSNEKMKRKKLLGEFLKKFPL